MIKEKIPDKVMAGLQKAFSKSFYLIFEKGSAIIEKTYDKDSVQPRGPSFGYGRREAGESEMNAREYYDHLSNAYLREWSGQIR